jgi:hypothetical protein
MALTRIVYGEASVTGYPVEFLGDTYYQMVTLGNGIPVLFSNDNTFRISRVMGWFSEAGDRYFFCDSLGNLLLKLTIGESTFQALEIHEYSGGFVSLGAGSDVTNALYQSNAWDPDWESFQQYNFLEWIIQWDTTANTFTVTGSDLVWGLQSRTYTPSIAIPDSMYMMTNVESRLYLDDGIVVANFWKDYQNTYEV